MQNRKLEVIRIKKSMQLVLTFEHILHVVYTFFDLCFVLFHFKLVLKISSKIGFSKKLIR